MHLRLQRHVQLGRLRSRLQESLGVPTAELQEAIPRVREEEWTQQQVQEAVAALSSPDQRPAAIDANPVLKYFEGEGFRLRLLMWAPVTRRCPFDFGAFSEIKSLLPCPSAATCARRSSRVGAGFVGTRAWCTAGGSATGVCGSSWSRNGRTWLRATRSGA